MSSKRPSQIERSVSYSKAGKVVYTTNSKLSTDGKALTVSVKGTNPTGQAVDGTVVYDKQ